MKRNHIFFLISVILIIGCKDITQGIQQLSGNNKKLFYGTWQLSRISHNEKSSENRNDPLLSDYEQQMKVKTGLIYSYFPDSSFTEIGGQGEYEFGKWNLVNKGKTIFFDTKGSEYTVNFFENNNRQIMKLENATNGEVYEFIKIMDLLSNYKEDPFYPENNKWKIKALHSENTGELQERLGNYFKHLALLLKAATERNAKSVNFTFSQGPVKIYNGGIGIHYSIDPNWAKAYFNESEAELAHKMFRDYLALSDYNGVNTGNWYIDDYNILISIYGDLKTGKFPSYINEQNSN